MSQSNRLASRSQVDWKRWQTGNNGYIHADLVLAAMHDNRCAGGDMALASAEVSCSQSGRLRNHPGWVVYIGIPIASHGGCMVPLWASLAMAVIGLISYVTLAMLLTGIVQARKQQKKNTANNAALATSDPAPDAGSSSSGG